MRTASSRREILLSRETLLGLVAVLVLAAACVLLGMWQFGRYENRAEQAAVIESNYDAAPVALDEVLPDIEAPLPVTAEWTPVELHGSYCTGDDCVLFVRNRQLSGRVGFWQLVPFRAEDGTTVLVVRGWVPSVSGASQPADPAPVPEGEMTVTVRLRPAEVVLDREPPPGQTHSVNPRQSAQLLGLSTQELVTGAYGELAAEEPPGERPAALPSPDTSLGPHLSYAFQWWIFALFFPAALVYRTRRQFQDLAAEEQQAHAEAAPAAQPGRRTADHRPRRAVRTRRRGQDEEEEDALIDQQRP
ncbi:SURF1 family protein [Brachybacterium vulturis]|uniref:SURF1 family cytochrome oxidase biogenesis protein n=1 Tax=Brachybacterium vulturis TaxID=2017484 RepID=UPI003735AF07